MKKAVIFTLALAVAGLVYAFIPGEAGSVASTNVDTSKAAEGAIQWLTWDEAVKANAKKPKKIFIDMYTDWCGWCKRMDATTFSDAAVAKYVNENFYPVKFNAEQKEDITFQGETFKWAAGGGRGGVHMLAYSLLDGKLGYPSYVYLTPKFERILISPGYKQVPEFQKEIKFVAENHYEKTTWEQFQAGN